MDIGSAKLSRNPVISQEPSGEIISSSVVVVVDTEDGLTWISRSLGPGCYLNNADDALQLDEGFGSEKVSAPMLPCWPAQVFHFNNQVLVCAWDSA